MQASSYSEIGPIPVALLGLIGYVLILVSLFVRGDVGRALTFMLTLSGFAFSLYLTYLEVFVIDAICQWCLAERRRDGGAVRSRDGQVAASRRARPTCSRVITPVRRPSSSTAARPPSRRSSMLASRASSGSSELTV